MSLKRLEVIAVALQLLDIAREGIALEFKVTESNLVKSVQQIASKVNAPSPYQYTFIIRDWKIIIVVNYTISLIQMCVTDR